MADTIIPKPDPAVEIKTTFEPTPVAAPATTAPDTSPAAVGVAAPGVAPASQSTAPSANNVAAPGVADTPKNPAADAANANATMAQPAQDPYAAQKAAAAGAAKASSAASTAENAKGQASAAATGAAAATASDTASKKAAAPATAKTAAKATQQPTVFTDEVNKVVKNALDGNDPVFKVAYNNLITGVGPRNQAALSNMAMKLKQSNMDGQGAGDALLAMMARDNEYTTDQLVGQLSLDSAKRIQDMNKWGVDTANKMAQDAATQKRNDLQSMIKLGNVDGASKLFADIFPGVPFNAASIKAADPARVGAYNSNMKVIDDLVHNGKGDEANALMQKTAEMFPEMFSATGDPAEALALVKNIDYSQEAWQAKIANNSSTQAAIRTAALQGPAGEATLNSSIDQYFASIGTQAVENIAKSSVKSMSLDDINAALEAAGMAPVATTDEASMLPKQDLARAITKYNAQQDAVKEAPDQLLSIFAKEMPSLMTDPEEARLAKAYLSNAAYSLATSTDGNVSIDSFDSHGAIPPWDPASVSAPSFLDWPKATFKEDGTFDLHYEGLRPYDKNHKGGDTSTPDGQDDVRLDKAYQNYLYSKDTPQPPLDMKKWYFASKGGTATPDTKSLGGVLGGNGEVKPEDFKPTDETDPVTGVRTVTTLDPLTKKPVTTKTPPVNLYQTSGDIQAQGVQAWLASNPSGMVAISPDGKQAAQITGKTRDTGIPMAGRVLEVKKDGYVVYFDPEHQNWYQTGHDGKWEYSKNFEDMWKLREKAV
jgi:hypothetical protein